MGTDAQHSSALVKDHVANDGVRESVAEVTPFSPGVLTLIHAVVGCGKNPRVVLRVDDDGVNRNVGQIAGAIAPALATIRRSKDMIFSKGRANGQARIENEFTAPGKSFLCMDLSQPTREQKRSHRCNSPPVDKDL
jgi:hypothetical protein